MTLVPGAAAYFGLNKNSCVGRAEADATRIRVTPPGDDEQLGMNYPLLDYCGPGDPRHAIDITPIEATPDAVLAHR